MTKNTREKPGTVKGKECLLVKTIKQSQERRKKGVNTMHGLETIKALNSIAVLHGEKEVLRRCQVNIFLSLPKYLKREKPGKEQKLKK